MSFFVTCTTLRLHNNHIRLIIWGVETNDNSVGLTFDILTIAIVYAILLFINYIIFWAVLQVYSDDLNNYQTVKQIIDYAHIIMPVVMLFLAMIHGLIFMMEAYLPLGMSEASEGE